MAETLTTTVTELPESRVRVEVQVPPGEVQSRVEHKARQLGRELKLPGFRRGKVPAPLVIQRVGREAVLEEAVRDTLGSWYAQAIVNAGIVPVGDPELDLGKMPPQGQALSFSIEIGVLPKAQLGQYKGLEVGRGEPHVDEQLLEKEIERLRERLAKLHTAERPAERGDYVVIDYLGSLVQDSGAERVAQPAEGRRAGPLDRSSHLEPFAGGEGRDQLVELGSDSLIPGFEDALIGARAGDARTVALDFPADYGHEQLAGRPASFEVTVKEVKRKDLPALDEDFAIDAGFDTVEDLRQDIRTRLLEVDEQRVQSEFRDAALDAAVAQAAVQVTPALMQARAQEMWERMLHSLSHRGITRETYLQIDGRPEPEILAELAPDAERALRREAVLTAVVEAEGIEPSEPAVLEAITPTAEREGVAPEELLARLRDSGRLEELREDLAARQAIDLIAAEAASIGLEQARAREQLWTPEKEERAERAIDGDPAHPAHPAQAGAAHGRLWTPDR